MLVINIKDIYICVFLGLLLGLGLGFSITIYGLGYAQLSVIRFAELSDKNSHTHTHSR